MHLVHLATTLLKEDKSAWDNHVLASQAYVTIFALW